jgi:hypothetical protein
VRWPAAIVQAQISASQGSFTLTYPGVQRMLTNEARTAMPGAQVKKADYSHKLLYLGISGVNMASADVIIEWQGTAMARSPRRSFARREQHQPSGRSLRRTSR